MQRKPPHGTPCNGCGGCCVATRCPLGQALFGPGPDCPALTPEGCGLVLHPHRYADGDQVQLRDGAALLVGAGLGCDALLEGELPDLAFRRRMRAWGARKAPAARRALQRWLRGRRQ